MAEAADDLNIRKAPALGVRAASAPKPAERGEPGPETASTLNIEPMRQGRRRSAVQRPRNVPRTYRAGLVPITRHRAGFEPSRLRKIALRHRACHSAPRSSEESASA